MGIEFSPSAPYTPAENGRAKRVNRTLNNATRSMLSNSSLPHEFLAECLMTAVDARNCIPEANENKSPFEQLTGTKPNVSHFCVFGCRTHARVSDAKRKKLHMKSKKGIVLRSISHGEYRIWLGHESKVETTRHCHIIETEFPARCWRQSSNLNQKFSWTIHMIQKATPSMAPGGEQQLPPGGAPQLPPVDTSPPDKTLSEIPGDGGGKVGQGPKTQASPTAVTSTIGSNSALPRRNPPRVRKPAVKLADEYAGYVLRLALGSELAEVAVDKPISDKEAVSGNEKQVYVSQQLKTKFNSCNRQAL